MAMILASLASFGTRVCEYSVGYDRIVKDYLEAKDDDKKEECWQAIMDNISLYPKRHKALLGIKFSADVVVSFGIYKAVSPIIKRIGSQTMQKIKNCWSKFVDFLNRMYQSVQDIYASSDSMAQKFVKIRNRLCESLMDAWKKFMEIVCDTLKYIKDKNKELWKWIKEFGVSSSKNANGQTVLQMGSVTFIPTQMLESAWSTISKGFKVVFSTVALLLQWVGSQLTVEAYKYYCSLYGLTIYTFNQVPDNVRGERMRHLA